MPLYMDIHEVPGGVSAEDVAKAHAEDVKIEHKYGVKYTKYWANEKAGKIFCLCHAPNAEAAIQVHREAHGMVADKVIEIQPELAEGFLGGVEVNSGLTWCLISIDLGELFDRWEDIYPGNRLD